MVATGPDGEEIERYSDDPPLPGTDGEVTALPMYAGERVGRVEAVRPAADVVEDLVASTCQRLDQLSSPTGP